MRFSVIIPLEAHRGLAERCLRTWSAEQSFPRGEFEIIAAESNRTVGAAAVPTAPQDRLLRLPFAHDMPLAAAAAQIARGDALVFTEAHCLPERDFLSRSAEILDRRTDWVGFSGRSIPITHNLLSEIEAEFYIEHIERNMLHHPWLKVLDQCFVVRREAYRAVGGLEPQYGHFAEWVLAARLHRAGYTIGYDPGPAVRHYYVGKLSELEEFTMDFAAGQVRFAQFAHADPCGDLFEKPYEATRQPDSAAGVWRRLFERSAGALGAWLAGRRFSRAAWVPPELLSAEVRRRWMRLAVYFGLCRGDRPLVRKAFFGLISACIQAGGLRCPADMSRRRRAPERSETGRGDAAPLSPASCGTAARLR